MMRFLAAFLALTVVPAVPSRALRFTPRPSPAASGRVQCGSAASKILGRPVPYCALLPPSYDADAHRRFPVLYWLHGLGQDEQALANSGGWTLVDELRRRGTIGDFLIITPEAGGSFYLNSRDGHTRYEDFFLEEFLPDMERRFRILPGRETRGVSGASMGGFGALHFGLKYAQRFGSVSAHSAALMEKPPELLNSGPRIGFLGEVFGHPVDPAYWQRNSVFTLARNAARTENWKIYFDCGSEDDYGFDQGNQALDRLLTARGIRHEFHLYPGAHGWSYFARHLPASLEFHWRVFAAAPGQAR